MYRAEVSAFLQRVLYINDDAFVAHTHEAWSFGLDTHDQRQPLLILPPLDTLIFFAFVHGWQPCLGSFASTTSVSVRSKGS